MDFARAMAQLPGDDALALFLTEAGASHEAIAERLGIDLAAVAPLLDIARRKLAALLDEPA